MPEDTIDYRAVTVLQLKIPSHDLCGCEYNFLTSDMDAIFDIAELVAVTLQISSKLYEYTLKSQSTTIPLVKKG